MTLILIVNIKVAAERKFTVLPRNKKKVLFLQIWSGNVTPNASN